MPKFAAPFDQPPPPPVLPLVLPLARSAARQTLIIDTPKFAVPSDQPPPPPVLPLVLPLARSDRALIIDMPMIAVPSDHQPASPALPLNPPARLLAASHHPAPAPSGTPPVACLPRSTVIDLVSEPVCLSAFATPLVIARICSPPTAPPCFVFHPDHPMPELVHDSAATTSLFGHSFGIPFTDSLGVLQTRQLSWAELLPAYSPALAALRPLPTATAPLIADLRRCLPPAYCTTLCTESLSVLLRHSTTPTAATSHVARCLTTTANPLPSTSAWNSAYASDSVTATLFRHLSSKLAWTPTMISELHPSFQQYNEV